MFPSRSEVRIEYSGLLQSKRELKAEIDTIYSSYRFFTVDVDHSIIKKSKGKETIQQNGSALMKEPKVR